MIKRTALFVAVTAALSGCQQVSEMSYSDYRALAIQKNKDCITQGVKPGTKEMEVCVIHEMRREDASRQANQQRRMAAAAAMQAMSNGYNASAAAYGQSASSPVRCTTTPQSTFVGGTPSSYRTSCY